MPDSVSRELFDERTFHITRKIDELGDGQKAINGKLEVLPQLAKQVEHNQKEISGIKRWGLRILLVLASSGGTLGAIKIKDILHLLGFGG